MAAFLGGYFDHKKEYHLAKGTHKHHGIIPETLPLHPFDANMLFVTIDCHIWGPASVC
jgi:hypothetical protein